MSQNRLIFEGLTELRAALRALPAELTAEAGHIVEGAANGAAADVKAAYPVRTGSLRDHLVVLRESGSEIYSAAVVVKNTAPHAALFEFGTQTRQSAIGANRGSMPPGHVFIPRMIKARRLMYAQLKALLERKGLGVSGDA